MKVEVRNLKVGDVFTESGITVRIENIQRDDLMNGKENYQIEATSIDYNKKMYPKMPIGLPCFYSKQADTKVNVK